MSGKTEVDRWADEISGKQVLTDEQIKHNSRTCVQRKIINRKLQNTSSGPHIVDVESHVAEKSSINSLNSRANSISQNTRETTFHYQPKNAGPFFAGYL